MNATIATSYSNSSTTLCNILVTGSVVLFEVRTRVIFQTMIRGFTADILYG